MVKCTKSTAGSARNNRRQLRSPWFGSPETSSTRSRSRTPSRLTTAWSFSSETSPGSAAALSDTTVGPAWGDRHVDAERFAPAHAQHTRRRAVTLHRHRHGAARVAIRHRPEILDHGLDRRRLMDDAEAGRLDQPQPPVGLLATRRDQHVERHRRRMRRRIAHHSVSDGDDAGQPVGGDRRPRGVDRAEQTRAVMSRLRHLQCAQLQSRQASPRRR